MIEPLDPEVVSDLCRPQAHPDDASAAAGVEHLQTHLSHLFLTRARVVKLRKAVELGFVDFSRRAERIEDCRREVTLNRRLAPDVYLGVAPLRRVDGHYVVREADDAWLSDADAPGESRECVVVMRRLEPDRDALSLLEAGKLQGEQLDAVAAVLARFHDAVGLGRPAPWQPADWWQHLFRPFGDTLAALAGALPAGSGEALAALSRAGRERFEALRPCFEQRRLAGLAVDGHGDVHLQHVWFESEAPEPVLIDCVEFDANLRRSDAANEVAFLAMDLSYRGRRDLAARFLRRYAEARDDFGLFSVVDAFQAYRAAVRAKVAALAASDSGIGSEQRVAARGSAERHLALARESVATPAAGALVLVCGTVGVGKSSAAQALADRTAGVVISSDRTRKHLAGIPPEEHRAAAPDRGLYAPEQVERVYRALLERAGPVLDSGRVAILDATFARAEERARARAWAAQRGAPALLLEVDCDEAVTRQRLERRSRLGRDPSDAGPELVAISRERFEAASEWNAPDRYGLRTDREDWAEALEPIARRLRRE
jgi:aminoglycoside phosphotransferase family enzyme/predicted kinase